LNAGDDGRFFGGLGGRRVGDVGDAHDGGAGGDIGTEVVFECGRLVDRYVEVVTIFKVSEESSCR
jgi:hypothetical protein